MTRQLTLQLFCFIIIACKTSDSKYPYAIKDFSEVLRPHLTQIVSNGLIGISPSEKFLEKNASNEELDKLSFCEHPLLRAVAIRALLQRDSVNQNKVILRHLSDTAFIVVEVSDWGRGFTGIDFSSIADDMIKHSSWKSFTDRQKVIDKIIRDHNYLVSAYQIADRLDPEEKYYSGVREMIIRKRDDKEIINVIIALSKFKKKQDIPLIKDVIKKHNDELKFPATIFEYSQAMFFNYFDSLNARWMKSGKEFGDHRVINWDSYE